MKSPELVWYAFTCAGLDGSAQVFAPTTHVSFPGLKLLPVVKDTCAPTVESTVIHEIPGVGGVPPGITALPPPMTLMVTSEGVVFVSSTHPRVAPLHVPPSLPLLQPLDAKRTIAARNDAAPQKAKIR